MNIQSLSVCVPAKRCINDCVFCCSKMHGGEYEDKFTGIGSYPEYVEAARKRLEYARNNGCNTLMLTGNNEPQQNIEFLKVFSEINRSLPDPFLNIEMQTSGAFITKEMLHFLQRSVGVTTVAVSVACLNNDAKNRELIQTKDENLQIGVLADMVKGLGMNLRICLNMNDFILTSKPFAPSAIKYLCGKDHMNADQITFRALWASDMDTPQGCWIAKNVTQKTYDFIEAIKEAIKHDGTYLDTLEYGAKRYDWEGFSVVVDEDSMAQDTKEKDAVKYLILRPNGHLYSKWDSKASLIF